MPGHVGIICNEAVHVAAVETTLQGTLSLFCFKYGFSVTIHQSVFAT
jgi:hypothetical protein